MISPERLDQVGVTEPRERDPLSVRVVCFVALVMIGLMVLPRAIYRGRFRSEMSYLFKSIRQL